MTTVDLWSLRHWGSLLPDAGETSWPGQTWGLLFWTGRVLMSGLQLSLSERLDTKTPGRSSKYQPLKNNGFKSQTLLDRIAHIFDET